MLVMVNKINSVNLSHEQHNTFVNISSINCVTAIPFLLFSLINNIISTDICLHMYVRHDRLGEVGSEGAWTVIRSGGGELGCSGQVNQAGKRWVEE